MRRNQKRVQKVQEQHARKAVEAQKRLEKLEKQACSFKVGQVIDGYGEIVRVKCMKKKGRKKGPRDYKVSFKNGRFKIASRLIEELSNDKPALIMGGYDLTKGLHGQACDDLIEAWRHVERHQAKFVKIIRVNGQLDKYISWVKCKHDSRANKELVQAAQQFLDMSKLMPQERTDYDKFIRAQMSLSKRLSIVVTNAKRDARSKAASQAFRPYERACIEFIKKYNETPSSLPLSDMKKMPKIRAHIAYYAFCLRQIFQHETHALELGEDYKLAQHNSSWLIERDAIISHRTYFSRLPLPGYPLNEFVFKGLPFPEGGYTMLMIAPLKSLLKLLATFSHTEFAREFRLGCDDLNKQFPQKHRSEKGYFHMIEPLRDRRSVESIPDTGWHMTDPKGRFICMMRICYAHDLAEKYVMQPYRCEQDMVKKKSLGQRLVKAMHEMGADGAEPGVLIKKFSEIMNGLKSIVKARNLLPQDIAKTVANTALCYYKIFMLQRGSNKEASQRALVSAIDTQKKGLVMASQHESILRTSIPKWEKRLGSWSKARADLTR